MDQFPPWAAALLGKEDDDSVSARSSHGLNLALKLRRPALLPLLLWDIVVSQPQIRRALNELTFLHYARFVPSWDGTALMVVTEFDGPLDPYVMDFVIALGDVFDKLLGYVDPRAYDPRWLPVRQHPEEFLAFVRRWNRVAVAPPVGNGDATRLPADFDYPVFSAYPTRSVVAIDGPRTERLPPALDRPAAFVDLDDVQGHLLNGSGATKASHRFLVVDDAAAARRWLGGAFANAARRGAAGARQRSRQDGGALVNVAFTFAGLAKLLPHRAGDLQAFPAAFREGARQRAEANHDTGPSHPRHWRFGGEEQDIDVVVTLYVTAGGGDAAAETAAEMLLASHDRHGLREVAREQASARPDGREPFGFRDGITQPRVSGQRAPTGVGAGGGLNRQPASSVGEFLLGADYTDIYGGPSLGPLAPDLAHNGTFGVLRLLQQDVDRFEKMATDEAVRLGTRADLIKTKLVGRWPDGQPLVRDPFLPTPLAPGTAAPSNDFDYAPSWEYPGERHDHQGVRCPVGAHVRRANPRSGRVAGHRHTRRLLRRGLPSVWLEDGDNKPRVGLMALFIGASIERQFEFIQRQWIQGTAAGGTQDPIAGQRECPIDFDIPGLGRIHVPPLVTVRGCLYLFYPGIGALRAWAAVGETAVAAVPPDGTAGCLQRSARLIREGMRGWLDALRRLPGPLVLAENWALACLLTLPATGRAIDYLVSAMRRRGHRDGVPETDSLRPLDPDFVVDPFPAFAAMRREGKRVVWVPSHGAWWVLHRDGVRRLFAEPKHFAQKPSSARLRGIITLDGERHRVVRGAVREALKVALARAKPGEVAGAAWQKIAPLAHFDAVTAYTSCVPAQVFWEVFGLSTQQIDPCDRLAQTMVRHYGQPLRPGMGDNAVLNDAGARLGLRLAVQLLRAMVPLPCLGGRYGGTLIGEVARRTAWWPTPPRSPRGERVMGFLEATTTLVQVVVAGQSARFLLGTALRRLLLPDPRPDRAGQRPWDALVALQREDDERFRSALDRTLEEVRRVDSPVTIVERYAAGEVTFDGVTIAGDEPVFAVVASANRDGPDAEALESFHWDRDSAAAHLSFGHGLHECIGQPLQAMVVPTALARLMEVAPDLRLCDPNAVPAWVDNVYFRCLQALPVQRDSI